MTRAAASRAVRARASRVVDVARVDVAQSVADRDFARTRQRRGRRARLVHHLPVRMERGEVQRHVRSELVGDPARHLLQLGVRIVLVRDQERRDLEPHPRLVPQIFERLEHRAQLGAADLAIEALGEAFEVDVGRIHVAVELRTRLRAHVAGRHGDAAHAALATRIGDVDRVLHEDDRIVVRVRDARAAEAPRRRREHAPDSRGRRACPSRATCSCPSSDKTCRPDCSRQCRTTAPRCRAGND